MNGRAKLLNLLISSAMLALCGCGDDSVAETTAEPVPSAPATAVPEETAHDPALVGDLPEGFAPIAFDLAGTGWLVVEIDGEPLAATYPDLATVNFTGSMLYWRACNGHEGLYVRTGTSFAVGRVTTTLATCEADSPDAVMATILGRRPLIGSNAEGKIMLVAGGRSMTLSQIDGAMKDVAAPPLETAPFRLSTPDSGASPPVLSFKGKAFSVWMDCPAAITGKASVNGQSMTTSDVNRSECETHRPTATASLEEFLSRRLSIARGPNGELMLSDGDTVITGQQCHPDASGCRHAELAGESGA